MYEKAIVVLNNLALSDDQGCFAYAILPHAIVVVAPTLANAEAGIVKYPMLAAAVADYHCPVVWRMTDESSSYENLTAQGILYEASRANPGNVELLGVLELLESFVACMDTRITLRKG